MKKTNENQWLEPLLARYMYREPVMFDFQQWAQRYPKEAQLLERGFEDYSQGHKTKTYHIWRLIMESKITRYSAAAVVALAIALILLSPFWMSQHGVLLADVQKKVAQVDTMILRGQKIFSSVAEPNISFEFDIVKYISRTYGYTEKGYIKDDLVYSITFNLPEKQTIILFPIWKKMRKFPFTEAQLKLMENLTPNGIIDFLLQSEYEELGTKEIDGIEVQGFEFQQDAESVKGVLPKSLFNIEKCKGSVWVGVEELLPVRMEGDISIGKCLFTAFTDFNLHEVNVLEEYNVELNEEIFDTGIPEGYTEFKISDILPFIPVKAKAGLAGLGAVPICLIVWKRLRRKKTTIMQ